MSNTAGHGEALKRWRANLTPEQKEQWRNKIKQSMRIYKSQKAQAQPSGDVLNITAKVYDGVNKHYKLGSSITVTILGVPANPQMFLRALEESMPNIKNYMLNQQTNKYKRFINA